MSYVKIIKYGNNAEVYVYEYPPVPQGKRKINKDREKVDENEKFEKRKDNAFQAQRNFRRLVGANLNRETPLLISLTYEKNMQDITTGYKDYKSFIQALRYKYGKNIKYIVVPEFQKRGAVHFHALFWGLPKEVFSEERRSRTINKLWGKGFVDVIQTDGHGKISSYLAKYMAKAFVDRRLKNQKAYVSSRNIQRPVVETIVIPTSGDPVRKDRVPVLDRKYKTKWMGECRHRLFKI